MDFLGLMTSIMNGKNVKNRKNHQRKLEEIRRQQKLDEEAERERTRKANELFLARHQSNTPTQRYIDRFCNKNSDIDITDEENHREALSPKGVNYEVIQKHNSKLYKEYLQSPLWKIISSKVKWNANYRCEKCGSNKNLVVHHTSYEFKGIEFLAFHTLQCLCSKCHEKEHGSLQKNNRRPIFCFGRRCIIRCYRRYESIAMLVFFDFFHGQRLAVDGTPCINNVGQYKGN